MMKSDNTLNILKKIQKTQNNIVMYSAITMGMILIIYFFTFAMLVDKGYKSILMFEIVTSIIFFASFFFLNKIAFHATRLLYRRRQPHSSIIRMLSAADIARKPEELLPKIDPEASNNMLP